MPLLEQWWPSIRALPIPSQTTGVHAAASSTPIPSRYAAQLPRQPAELLLRRWPCLSGFALARHTIVSSPSMQCMLWKFLVCKVPTCNLNAAQSLWNHLANGADSPGLGPSEHQTYTYAGPCMLKGKARPYCCAGTCPGTQR